MRRVSWATPFSSKNAQNAFTGLVGPSSGIKGMDNPLRGKSGLEIWTKKEIGELWEYLHNGNGPLEWTMGMVDRDSGKVRFCRSKKIPVGRGISWALDSFSSGKPQTKLLAFIPHSSNHREESRWGAFDFDAHDGNEARARALAFSATEILRSMNFAVILEFSGNGWHVWAIADEFKSVDGWVRLLKKIISQIGAELRSGICEIFPQDSRSSGLRKGLRAPGAWNPKTGKVSEIHQHNIDGLLARLRSIPSFAEKSLIREPASLFSVSSSIKKEESLSSLSLKELLRIIRREEGFEISQPSIRHAQLSSLVGTVFRQVSREVAKQMAQAQFAEKRVPTAANAKEHADEFDNLWAGMERQWLAGLSPAETNALKKLVGTHDLDAFRIFQNFANFAREKGERDFPIACDNIAMRVAMTREGAGKLRRRFVDYGVIEKTTEARTNIAAARYRWLL